MGLVSILPHIFEHAEKVYPGHAAELVYAFDAVSNASVFVGFSLGVFLTLVVQSLLSRVLSRIYRSARYQRWRAVQDAKLLSFIRSRRGKDAH